MDIPRKWGIPGILEAFRVVARLDAKYRTVIVQFLSSEERLRYIAVMEAINLFLSLAPFPGDS